MNTFLVSIQQGKPKVKIVSGLQDEFILNGLTYKVSKIDFSDFDHLRDRQGRLIGFYFIIDETEPIFKNPFFHESSSISYAKKELKILLADSPYEIETVQGIGCAVFQSHESLILAIPDWNNGEIGFPLDDTTSFSNI